MYTNIPLFLSIVFVLTGLAALAWSADVFVDGAAAVARKMGISSFIIGMVVIGFGTSAPELIVSVLSGVSDHSNLSLGNAYGSCIFNIAAILGIAAMIRPLKVKPSIRYVAVPVLVAISVLSWFIIRDGAYSRADAFLQLGCFAVVLPAYCWFDQKTNGKSAAASPSSSTSSVWKDLAKLVVGLGVLVGSSHILVWGAVDLARAVGVSELLIGLTIVAAGTSLPELASAVVSARKGEHEFVLGNIIGSNLFNTLAVVGLAGAISPFRNFSPLVAVRDLPLMVAMSLSILVFGMNWRRPMFNGRVGFVKGLVWLLSFVAYTAVMIYQETHGA